MGSSLPSEESQVNLPARPHCGVRDRHHDAATFVLRNRQTAVFILVTLVSAGEKNGKELLSRGDLTTARFLHCAAF